MYEQYLPRRFSSGKSPFLNRSASKGKILSCTLCLPLYRAVRYVALLLSFISMSEKNAVITRWRN